MKYTLIMVFLATGDSHKLDYDMSLQSCAGQAAIERGYYLEAIDKLKTRLGEVRFLCNPQPTPGPHSS